MFFKESIGFPKRPAVYCIIDNPSKRYFKHYKKEKTNICPITN